MLIQYVYTLLHGITHYFIKFHVLTFIALTYFIADNAAIHPSPIATTTCIPLPVTSPAA
ncbi:MAG: hypothetical protein N3E39_00765 [Candidatus Methanomethylicia archaeon]|nr:hypothetical protein [Candidatus Methanomethylicia archaeon]